MFQPAGLLESPLSYSCMQEVYCISRWDPARKYCLRIVMPHGSLLLQVNIKLMFLLLEPHSTHQTIIAVTKEKIFNKQFSHTMSSNF